MNIVKSKGGYFYKEYKNGRKKRISKIEYDKLRIKYNKKGGSNRPIINAMNLRKEYSHIGLKKLFSNKPLIKINVTNLRVIDYINQYLCDDLPLIHQYLTISTFYKDIMAPLLIAKGIKIKKTNDNSVKFGAFAEPFFHPTYHILPNFQDLLSEWWCNISTNFTVNASEYKFLSTPLDVLLPLIQQGPQSNCHYFDLQLPVVFINRILQMLEFYLKILFQINNHNLLKSKNNLNNPEFIIEFKEFLDMLDQLYGSNFSYSKLFEAEKSVLDWYKNTIHFSRNLPKSTISFRKKNSNKSIDKLNQYFNDSYSSKYCILPISLSPKEEKFLKTYCIPVIIYLSKHKIVHEGNYGIAHPTLQINHDGSHFRLQELDHLKLSVKTPDFISKTFLFRKMFIQLVIREKNLLLVEFIFFFLHEIDILTFMRSIYMNIVSDIVSEIETNMSEQNTFNRYFHFYFSWNEFETFCNNDDIPITMFMNPILIYSLFMKLNEMNNFKYRVTYKTDENLNQDILHNLIFYVEKVCHLVKTAFEKIYQKEIPILDINVKGNKTSDDMIEYTDYYTHHQLIRKKFYS